MNWYEKLKQYFPEEEMKKKRHMERLLNDKKLYKMDEHDEYVILYAIYPSFIFVDYIYVAEHARSNGIGKKLIERLKESGKTIILEVEPPHLDEDCKKRLRFYNREGFEHASSIEYVKRSPLNGEDAQLEVLYWAKQPKTDHEIFSMMRQIYNDIHSYKVSEFYKHSMKPASETLKYRPGMRSNILESDSIVTSAK